MKDSTFYQGEWSQFRGVDIRECRRFSELVIQDVQLDNDKFGVAVSADSYES